MATSDNRPEKESFEERINGRAVEWSALWVTINGQRFQCTYVRPMNAKPHRCVVAWKYDDRRFKFATVSTRKVTFV